MCDLAPKQGTECLEGGGGGGTAAAVRVVVVVGMVVL